MPPKRVAVTEPETSPEPKRRVKSTTAQRKRKDDDTSGEETVKKIRRKKSDDEAEEETAVTTSDNTTSVSSPLASTAVTPAKKARRKSMDPETATKAPRSVKKVTKPETPVAGGLGSPAVTAITPKSVKKTAATPKAVTPRVIQPPCPMPYAPKLTPVKRTPAEKQQVVSHQSSSARGQEGLIDEAEIISVWTQAVNALHLAGNLIVPIFLSIVLYCYFNGKLNQDQAVASVGIVFALFLVLIMGTYVLAIIPFILVSRFLTSLVTDAPVTAVEQKQTNLSARLFLFFTILGSIVLIFQHLESTQQH